MDTNSLIRLIVQECQSDEGFLIKLHVENNFDSDEYNKLMSHLEEYRRAIEGSDVISREVAGCVFFLIQYLEEAVRSGNTKSESKDKVAVAHAQTWDLATLLFQ